MPNEVYCSIDKQRVSVCVSRRPGKRAVEILGKTTKLRNGKRGRGKGKPETAGCLCALCGPLGNLKIKRFFLLFERV